MIKYNFEQQSQAWNEIRVGRITGTRFKFLMQSDGTVGYKDLITDLVGEIITGKKEESYSNAIMERGIDLEPIAAFFYSDMFGIELESVGFITPDEDNKFVDWTGISPDRLITNDILLEIKCPIRKTHLNYIKKDVLPSTYKYQVQAQLFVTGAEKCIFMSYYPDLKPFLIDVFPDKEIHSQFEIELEKIIPLINKEINNYNNYEYI